MESVPPCRLPSFPSVLGLGYAGSPAGGAHASPAQLCAQVASERPVGSRAWAPHPWQGSGAENLRPAPTASSLQVLSPQGRTGLPPSTVWGFRGSTYVLPAACPPQGCGRPTRLACHGWRHMTCTEQGQGFGGPRCAPITASAGLGAQAPAQEARVVLCARLKDVEQPLVPSLPPLAPVTLPACLLGLPRQEPAVMQHLVASTSDSTSHSMLVTPAATGAAVTALHEGVTEASGHQ